MPRKGTKDSGKTVMALCASIDMKLAAGTLLC